jgi:two-component system cell cycle sensor histidine kinase/response regulator CckA
MIMEETRQIKQQLADELGTLHQRIEELGKLDAEHRKTEISLRESEEKYRTLIESTLDFVFTVDRKGLFTYINPRFEMVTGRTTFELIGGPFTDVIAPESRQIAAKQFKEGIRGVKSAPYEIDIIHKSGSRIPVEFNVTTLLDGNKQPIGRYGIGRDITERRQAESALMESEDRLHSIVQGSPISTFVIGKDHKVIYWNRALEELSQIRATEVIGTRGHWRAFYKSERPCMADILVDEAFDRIPELYAGKYRKSDLLEEAYEALDFFPDLGKEGKWLRFTAAAIRDTTGNLIGATETLEDITDRKRAEEALKQSEEKYRELVENANSIILRRNKAGYVTFFNEFAQKFFGYSEDEILGKNVVGTIVPEVDSTGFDMKSMIEDIGLNPDRYVNNINENIRRNGERVWIAWTNKPIRDEGGVVMEVLCIGNDITPRKKAEEALRESEEKYSAVVQQAKDGVILIQDNILQFVNEAMAGILGYTRNEMENSPYINYIAPESRAMVATLVKARLAGEAVPQVYESKLLRKDGTIINAELSANVIQYRGKPADVGIIRDITDRKQVEDALRESQQRLSDIIDFLPDATFVIDKESNVIAWNQAIETMTGVKAEEMLDKGDYEYSLPFYGDRRPILIDLALHPNQEMEMQYTSIQRMGDILFGEAFTPTLPPGNVHLSATASVLRDSKGEIIAAIECIRDNTERKRLEERLHRAEKMEALGTLAGGVAHDLNNVLGGLVGYSELLLMDIPEGNPWRRHVSSILQSSLRAAAIIQDLLTLARRGVAVSEIVNLNNVIPEHFKTPEFEKLKAYHPNVTFRMDLEKDLLNIKGSPIHLGKTLMNLVSNAAESISDGGEVTIRTENRYLDKPLRGYDDMREGDYVVLTVSDHGKGISATDIEKIFEPFYTKKAMGRSGTGLGLAVVWGTVKDHNGHIDVQSEYGKGSTFTLYFPATREDLAGDLQKISPEHYMGRGESILVVDDVKEQREVAASMLTRLGYKVHAVSGGEEAVAYLKIHTIDMLVLDMIMDPGIDGLETYRRVLEINPKQKAVIVSGYSETGRVKKAQELGAGSYVRKPYLLEKIGLAIRSELLKIIPGNP